MAFGIDDQNAKSISTESIEKDEQDCLGEPIASSTLPEKANQQQPTDTKVIPIEPTSQQQKSTTKGTYAEKTNRLQAWVQLIRSVAPFIWAIVILVVIIPLVGQIFIANAFSNKTDTTETNPPVAIVEERLVDWSKVNDAMKLTLDNAYKSAEDYASKELDVWVDELMNRVDGSFLDWYFGYFNQKQVEYKSLFVQISSGSAHLLNPNNPTSAEKVAEVITEDFQKEFAKRVLIPQTSQLRLERITQQTVKHYLDALRGNINNIPVNYHLTKADWERYLSEIAITINDTEGKKSNLSLKVLAGGGSYLALKPLVAPLALKVGSKVVTKLASKAGAKVAVKTGTALAGKLGAAVLDCTVGVGIILWDVWDTNHTAYVEKPILHDNLAAYLQEVKFSLLNNRENGIMTVVDQIQSKIVPNLNNLI
ncbi:hypothetical protein NDI49_30605 [Trichocoleus sp. ST-U3]